MARFARFARFMERENEIFVEDTDAENIDKVSESIDQCSGVPQGKGSFRTRIKDC